MEKAVFISDIDNLQYIKTGYSRIYFGNEFCQNLIPAIEDIKKALDFTTETKMRFSFVTPYINDDGLDKISKLLSYIKTALPSSEVIINDWGILRRINREFPELEPVLGRLLTKQKKGPRIMTIKKRVPNNTIEHFKQTNADSTATSDFLIKNRIHRIELDNLLQGISRPRPVLSASLYIPFAYITTSRYCLTRMAFNDEKFTRSITGCKRECRISTFKLSHRQMPADIYLKGNTQFLQNSDIPDNLEELKIDRLVFEPTLPM